MFTNKNFLFSIIYQSSFSAKSLNILSVTAGLGSSLISVLSAPIFPKRNSSSSLDRFGPRSSRAPKNCFFSCPLWQIKIAGRFFSGKLGMQVCAIDLKNLTVGNLTASSVKYWLRREQNGTPLAYKCKTTQISSPALFT